MKTILHVTEALNSGVAAALRQLVLLTPEAKHYLLAAERKEDQLDFTWRDLIAGHAVLPRGLFSAIPAIRREYQRLNPDFVHLHSSFAGAWGRLAGLPHRKIIYTPHCYAFERRDMLPLVRSGFALAEQLLAFGGGTVAACSPREVQLAHTMIASQQVQLVPNSVALPAALTGRPRTERATPMKVVMMGRIAAQKDPVFFAAAARFVKDTGAAVCFTWFGDGPQRRVLAEAGVAVSGWMPQQKLWERMAEADLYFHAAAWEGCPMAVLEAAALGLPILGRTIPSLTMLPLLDTVPTPAEAARKLVDLSHGHGWQVLETNSKKIRDRYAPDQQQGALRRLYEI